jgi:riboflavin kinase/FMN adenylyltransferase
VSGRTSVAIGTFDGVHLGHRAVLAEARAWADRLGGELVAVTFTPHPAEVVRPEAGPIPWITPPPARARQLRGLGVDRVEELRFDPALAAVPAEAFVTDTLVGRLGAGRVTVGEGFRFGAGGRGDVRVLAALGERSGFGVSVVAPVLVEGLPAASTRVRRAVAAGDLDLAARLLGRPFSVSGRVVEGDRRGRTLGFPTANLEWPQQVALPPDGVYAAWARLPSGAVHRAAASLGRRPTFGGGPRRLEAHLIGFAGDLYGAELELWLWRRLRDEARFADADALAAAIADDVARCRALLDAAPPDMVP